MSATLPKGGAPVCGEGQCVFGPDEALLARFGLSNVREPGETVLWLGASGRLALSVCGLPRSGVVSLVCCVFVNVAAIRELTQAGLSPRVLRILAVLLFLDLLTAFVLLISTRAVALVYAATSRRLIIKLRPDANRFCFASIFARRFLAVSRPGGRIDYPYAQVTKLAVRRWFFHIGDLDFRNFARKETKGAPRPSSAKKPLSFRFNLFPGGYDGATSAGPSASMAAGFYGIRRVCEVGALIQRQREANA